MLSVGQFYADWSSKSSCGLQCWSRSPPPLHGPEATADRHKERVKILLADFLMEKRGNWKSPADVASPPSVPQSRVGFAKKAREIAPGDRKIEIAYFYSLQNLSRGQKLQDMVLTLLNKRETFKDALFESGKL